VAKPGRMRYILIRLKPPNTACRRLRCARVARCAERLKPTVRQPNERSLSGLFMKPTRILPESYVHCYTLESRRHKIAQGILSAVGAGLILVLWQTVKSVFPDLLRALRVENTVVDRVIAAGTILLGIALIAILHEGIHGLTLRLFTGEWPSLRLTPFYAYVDASRWYLPRRAALVVSAAPVCVLTAIGALVLSVAPALVVRMAFWGMMCNLAGSVNDVAVATWVYLQPASVLVRNSGTALSVYRTSDQQGHEPMTKKRLRALLERSLERLR
jgi:hypothetical protein